MVGLGVAKGVGVAKLPNFEENLAEGSHFGLLCRHNRLKSKFLSPRTTFCSVQGLTLDIDRGNLLRLGKDGIILAASHGTRKMSDIEIEKT